MCRNHHVIDRGKTGHDDLTSYVPFQWKPAVFDESLGVLMPEFFISVNHTDSAGLPDGVAMEDLHSAVMAFNHTMQEQGRVVFIGALEQPTSAAQVVDATDAQPRITSGTASGAEIQLGGFWILKADSRAEALDLAAQASAACHQPVEVRQMQGY